MPLDPYTLGTAMNAISHLINGKLGRDLSREQFAEHGKRLERQETAVQKRFNVECGLRREHLDFTIEEAETARRVRIAERMEDFKFKAITDSQARGYDNMRRSFNASPDGWYIHDPFEHANPGIKSFRVLLQRPKGMDELSYNEIEIEIIKAIKSYSQNSIDHPINFPTGVWTAETQTGSCVANELHAFNSSIPTIILRPVRTRDGGFLITADLFGFPLGQTSFASNILLGTTSKEPEEVAKTLSLFTLAASDMYYLATYGKMPLLPEILPQYLQLDGSDAAVNKTVREIVKGYKDTVNLLLEETPQTGLYASLSLAKALIAFPDKSLALEQIKNIETMTARFLPQYPELVQRLQDLYIEAGAPEDAERLKTISLLPQNKINRDRLENHI